MLALYLSMLDSEEDKQSFAKIYDELKLLCYHVALKITRDKEMAEDAVHNAFLAVIKQKDEIFNLPCGNQRSKIVFITKNKAIDLLRMEKIRKYTPIDDMGDTIPDAEFDLTMLVENQESIEHLINCIASLPEKYKTVFEMRYINDMSNQEIASEIGIMPKAVSTRISRAKVMLQELLDGGAD